MKPSVASSPGWASASSSPTAIAIRASTISVSAHVPHHPTVPASGARLDGSGADFLALEIAPPQRNGPREGDRQRNQARELERLVGERGAGRQHRLAQGDDEEQPKALEEMSARDLRVPEVDALPTAGQPVQAHAPPWAAATASPHRTSRASPSAIAPATQSAPMTSSQTRSLTKCSPSARPRRATMRNAARPT